MTCHCYPCILDSEFGLGCGLKDNCAIGASLSFKMDRSPSDRHYDPTLQEASAASAAAQRTTGQVACRQRFDARDSRWQACANRHCAPTARDRMWRPATITCNGILLSVHQLHVAEAPRTSFWR